MSKPKKYSKTFRHKAFGDDFLNSENDKLHIPYLLPDKNFFTAITKESIKKGDWLDEHNDRGQTYDQYKKYNPLSRNRKTIYIISLEKANFDMVTLIDLLSCWYGKEKVNVKILDTKKIPDFKKMVNEIKERKSRGFGKQYYVEDIFTILKRIMPRDAYCLIALTGIDLYPRDDWNFVFGKASLKGRFGVFSYARYMSKGEESKLMKRITCVCTHEVGHMFGLKHCTYYRCLMNGSNSMEESDERPMTLCPICLRKLKKNIKLSFKKRYENLKNFYDNNKGFEKQKKWINMRIKYVESIKGKKMSLQEYKDLFEKMD